MIVRHTKPLIAIAYVLLATGCVSASGIQEGRDPLTAHKACMKMMPTGQAQEAATEPPQAHKCKMMEHGKPDAAADAKAPGHEHGDGSGPFLGDTQAPQAVSRQKAEIPVSAVGEVVVKFKDDGKVKDIIDLFWKDRSAAKARFDIFKRDRPEMAAAVLDRVTYSNELVLVYPCEQATRAEQTAALRQIVARLTSAPDIAYAEPDMIAHTQH
jgi:hypothetical protein